jgi:Domain of unknown function (DUF4111)/Nucleotidyltransferase domain
MPTFAGQPTPYPEINILLQALLSGVQAVLGNQFAGMYLHGSLVTGDFVPQRSDIDFLVVTASELPVEMLPRLQKMHSGITASGMKWADKLEGSYIPRQALRRYDPAHKQHPALRVDGSFSVDMHGSDWIIQRHILREQGLALAGPLLQQLIDPVQPEDLRRAVRGILHEWWSPPLHNPNRFNSQEYQAYAVLTMCRALYTLQHGAVVSKRTAAIWAQAALDKRWGDLIEQALAWTEGNQADHLQATLDFIYYTLAQSHRSTE